MKDVIRALKKRAEGFLIDAQIDLNEKRYDLAAFHIEQSIQ